MQLVISKYAKNLESTFWGFWYPNSTFPTRIATTLKYYYYRYFKPKNRYHLANQLNFRFIAYTQVRKAPTIPIFNFQSRFSQARYSLGLQVMASALAHFPLHLSLPQTLGLYR
jgi:hypothetical protein